MWQAKISLAAALGLAAALAFHPGAEAAKGPSTSPSSAGKVKKCAKGQIWHKTKKKCIKTSSGVLPDEDLFWQGRELALAGHYDWAIEVFSAMADTRDAEALKFIGYSYRKSGRFDRAVGYYQKALAVDPDNLTVREYLGEGYAGTGQFTLAAQQLHEIAMRCGQACEEYSDLADAIAQARRDVTGGTARD